MVRVEVIRNITVLARPRLERLELALGLAHITIEVVEVAQGLCLGSRIRIRRIKPLMVLDEHKHAVLAGLVHQSQVVWQVLRCGLRDQNVDLALDRVQCDSVVRGIRREYRYR